ncbi:MAG: ECF-type sigma factor [Gemmatimonadota bacterium]|nr:ECF-type sigma factor [Gemmatimonadota bacterium]
MSETSEAASHEPQDRRSEAAKRLLEDASADAEGLLDAFVEELYEDLRGIARNRLRSERRGHTLRTTALVHEAYLKLSRHDRGEWKNRAHFCAAAARAMRRILVNHAIARSTEKRGGDRVRVEMQDDFAVTETNAAELLALHDALEELESHHPRHARVVECRFFAGMTIAEVSDALEVSTSTVKRDWDMARAWLHRALAD